MFLFFDLVVYPVKHHGEIVLKKIITCQKLRNKNSKCQALKVLGEKFKKYFNLWQFNIGHQYLGNLCFIFNQGCIFFRKIFFLTPPPPSLTIIFLYNEKV
ncbi:unnamed protein product [Meganyctiphanes norvegica]|uniref:Uncharacterized protein n=1 Tax=Meganyctiphanes norvegica TaxID=48144 RepID=A0AAV2QJ46_MEGNR